MAKTPSKKGSGTKVTRIKASESSDTPKTTTVKAKTSTVKAKATPIKAKPAIDAKKHEAIVKAEVKEKRHKRNPLHPIIDYFKGSWYELTQVRWPDRKSSWGMTGALILFTGFFVVVILMFDYVFSQLFKLILGSN